MRLKLEASETQRSLQDLRELLADVPMPALTRHWVDENLRVLDEDAKCGVLSEYRRAELEELESEIDDIAGRIRSRRWYA